MKYEIMVNIRLINLGRCFVWLFAHNQYMILFKKRKN